MLAKKTKSTTAATVVFSFRRRKQRMITTDSPIAACPASFASSFSVLRRKVMYIPVQLPEVSIAEERSRPQTREEKEERPEERGFRESLRKGKVRKSQEERRRTSERSRRGHERQKKWQGGEAAARSTKREKAFECCMYTPRETVFTSSLPPPLQGELSAQLPLL